MTVMTDANVIDILKAQSLFPHGDCHPQCSLVVFNAVAGNPGSPSGELNVVEDYENITMVNPGEKPGERRKIWPAGGYNHYVTTD